MRLGFSHFQVRLLAAQSRIVNCWYGILGRRAGILVWRPWRCSVGHIRYGAAKRSLGRNSWRSSVSAYPRRLLEFQDDVAGKRAKSGRRLYVTSQPDRDCWPNWRQAGATACLSFRHNSGDCILMRDLCLRAVSAVSGLRTPALLPSAEPPLACNPV